MVKVIDSKKSRIKRRKRIRAKISGTAACPRLSVFRSAKHIYAQIIDDEAGKTLCSASTMEKSFEGFGGRGSKEGWSCTCRKGKGSRHQRCSI